MDKEIKDLLKQVLANQAIIYKRIEDIEKAVKGGGRLASAKTYLDELNKKSKELLPFIQ